MPIVYHRLKLTFTRTHVVQQRISARCAFGCVTGAVYEFQLSQRLGRILLTGLYHSVNSSSSEHWSHFAVFAIVDYFVYNRQKMELPKYGPTGEKLFNHRDHACRPICVYKMCVHKRRLITVLFSRTHCKADLAETVFELWSRPSI